MGWQKVSFKSDQYSAEAVNRVQEAFLQRWTPNGAPNEAALYAPKSLQPPPDVFAIYFTPRASEICAALLVALNATPVEPPNLESLSLLVGNVGA